MNVSSLFTISGRFEHLTMAYNAFQKTGQLGFYDNGQLAPFGVDDDLGIYFIIPRLATWLGLSLKTTMLLFFYGLLLGSAVIALVSFSLIYPSRMRAGLNVLWLGGLGSVYFNLVDTPKMYVVVPLALIPLSMYFLFTRTAIDKKTLLFLLFAGVVGMGGHFIRAYAGASSLLFIGTLILTNTSSWYKKVYMVAIVVLGMLVSLFIFNRAYAQYISYTNTAFPQTLIKAKRHPFWHSVYAGLAFLSVSRDHGFVGPFSDIDPLYKIAETHPGLDSSTPAYEQAVKHEAFATFLNKPGFVIKTLSAKFGVMLMMFLVYANLGILAACMYRKPWRLELAFGIALFFSSLYGLLIIPDIAYCLNFVTCSVLYGITSTNHALDQRRKLAP